MDERKQRILRAIIEDYVKTAEPVGSRTIAKNYNLGISPATVRNENVRFRGIRLFRATSYIGWTYSFS